MVLIHCLPFFSLACGFKSTLDCYDVLMDMKMLKMYWTRVLDNVWRLKAIQQMLWLGYLNVTPTQSRAFYVSRKKFNVV